MSVRNVKDRRLNSELFARRTTAPRPSIRELEEQLYAILSPNAFLPLRLSKARTGMRDRVLSVPVMSAIVFSLVLRGISSLREATRMLLSEGLMWAKLQALGHSAISDRFATLPAEIFDEILQTVIAHYHRERPGSVEQESRVLLSWQRRVAASFPVVWTTDAMTLDAMKRTTTWARQKPEGRGAHLGGMLHAVVESFSGAPVTLRHRANPQTDELEGIEHLLEMLPEGGLVIFDEGYFQFQLFDRMTDARQFFLTRMRAQVAYRTIEVLQSNDRVRDEIIEVGLYRAHPCRHRLRLVSVLWNGVWHRYVTNVLDPERLSAEDVVHLYRNRWRIETAFNQIKRLLGLSYLWVGQLNGVRIQLTATWIIYTLLVNLQSDLARHLGLERDRISFEMLYRSLYHYSRAIDRGAADDGLLRYLGDNARMLGILKERRKRHRQSDQQWALIWGYT